MPFHKTSQFTFDRRSFLAGSAISLPTALRYQRVRAGETLFDVAVFPGDEQLQTGCFGRAINRKATVVGIATTESGLCAVRTGGKALRELPDNDMPALANAVNDSGIVVGSVDSLAAMWSDDELRMLPEFGKSRTTAYAINAGGMIVGSADSGANASTAVYWTTSEAVELPSLGGSSSRALAINNDGVMVGFSTRDGEDDVQAVQWIDGEISGLGTLGGAVSQATAINRSGVIVGQSTREDGLSAVDHAFISREGKIAALPRLGAVKLHGRKSKVKLDRTMATGISDDGTVCGVAMSASENDTTSVAVLWLDDKAYDLNRMIGKASGDIVLTSADGINADREIVCTGYVIGEEPRSVIVRLAPE